MPQEHTLFINEEVAEVMGKSPSWLQRWGNGLMLGLVVILLTLSAIIYYPDVISGRADIQSSGITTVRSPRYSTRIIAAAVADGQFVNEGTPLYVHLSEKRAGAPDTVRAPHPGFVRLQRALVSRAQLPPQTPLLLLSPTDVAYRINILIPAFRAGKIDLGQKVFVAPHLFPKEEFGELEAEVVSRPRPVGNGLLEVEAELRSGTITTNGTTLQLNTQMSANASIIIENTTIFSRLFAWL